eukprot:m.139752 g.139752  ORF g.139752 m.139752 type:complete len:612 (+) comp17639_c0_seq5:384-2219(+)
MTSPQQEVHTSPPQWKWMLTFFLAVWGAIFFIRMSHGNSSDLTITPQPRSASLQSMPPVQLKPLINFSSSSTSTPSSPRTKFPATAPIVLRTTSRRNGVKHNNPSEQVWTPGKMYGTWWLSGIRSADVEYIHNLFDNNWTKRGQIAHHEGGADSSRNFCTFATKSTDGIIDAPDGAVHDSESSTSARASSANITGATSTDLHKVSHQRYVRDVHKSAAGLCPKTPGKLFIMESRGRTTNFTEDTSKISIVKFAGYNWIARDPVSERVRELRGPTHALCPANSHAQWNGLPHSVLTEMFVYHVDRVLQLHTAAPGKIMFFTPADVIKHFYPYSCGPDEDTGQERGCAHLCPRNIRDRANNYSNHVTAYANEHIVDCDNGDEHECCPPPEDPTHGKTLLLRSVLRTCDRNNNCFAQKGAPHADAGTGTYRSLSLDNDCVTGEHYYTHLHGGDKTYKPPSHPYTAKFHKCYLFPRSLREAYITRIHELRARYRGYHSPLLAAVQASMQTQMQHEHADDAVNQMLFARALKSRLTNRDVSGPPPYLAWDTDTMKTGSVSLLDHVATQIYALFTSCNARRNSNVSFAAYMDDRSVPALSAKKTRDHRAPSGSESAS